MLATVRKLSGVVNTIVFEGVHEDAAIAASGSCSQASQDACGMSPRHTGETRCGQTLHRGTSPTSPQRTAASAAQANLREVLISRSLLTAVLSTARRRNAPTLWRQNVARSPASLRVQNGATIAACCHASRGCTDGVSTLVNTIFDGAHTLFAHSSSARRALPGWRQHASGHPLTQSPTSVQSPAIQGALRHLMPASCASDLSPTHRIKGRPI